MDTIGSPDERLRPSARGDGVDASPGVRPGVPRERSPEPDPGAHWDLPAPQASGREALARSGVHRATPVFGTAQPARGLPGAVRRAAYRLPEWRALRWVLLLAADRIDVVEHRLARGWIVLPGLGALGLGYALFRRTRGR
jgi:hypothetical protein